MTAWEKLANLRILLFQMEKDLNLTELSAHERNVLSAAETLCRQGGEFQTQQLLAHKLLKGVSRATVYRAIDLLLLKGFLVKSSTAKRGFFRVQE